jgi:hypothetical protein
MRHAMPTPAVMAASASTAALSETICPSIPEAGVGNGKRSRRLVMSSAAGRASAASYVITNRAPSTRSIVKTSVYDTLRARQAFGIFTFFTVSAVTSAVTTVKPCARA